jgi:hypothetical protein
MKYLVIVFFLLTSQLASATCFRPESIEDAFGRPMEIIVVFEGVQSLDQCVGSNVYWIPEVEDYKASLAANTGNSGSSGAPQIVTAIEDSTLAITTAIACLCFFVGLNSWEASAK